MRHGKYEKKRKPSILTWALVCAALLATVIGGASAYLSMSADLQNNFSPAPMPEVTVDGMTVTVNPNGYAVYLRVAVDAYWESTADQTIWPEDPAVDFVLGTDWKKIGDYYYYRSKITTLTENNLPTFELPLKQPAGKDGYELKITVAAQVIQALGKTDDGTKFAVQDAWGVTPDDIEKD